ncbi:MAG: S1 family peptidase [Limnochordia bacterium]|nr:S1 family peptidase [Limnochordia bacterium]
MQTLLKAQRLAIEEVLDWPGVTGIAIGKKIKGGRLTDYDSVIIYVEKKLPVTHVEYVLPQAIGDILTDVVETGRITTQMDHTKRMRPAPGGCSIGHHAITAGTLGVVCFDRKTKEPVILSNNHVLANSTNGIDGRAKQNDPILQPGAYDGGQTTDVLGRLERFVPLHFGTGGTDQKPMCFIRAIIERILGWLGVRNKEEHGINIVDAAIARPVDSVRMEILGVGLVRGVTDVPVGTLCYKSGRTTQVSTGTLQGKNARLKVYFDEGQAAIFDKQLVFTSMSEPGDSGSLILEKGTNRAVGLLFAGSSDVTIANPIQDVLELLDLEF